MKINYEIIETRESDEHSGEYTGCGLRCTCGAAVAQVQNISTDRGQVARLAERLEREGVEPEHLFDVIYDMLCGGELI